MITPINTSFYGDNVRWFIGRVVDNNDLSTTMPLTRVKIRAFGIHDNIPEEKLPWASVVLPTTSGGTGRGAPSALDIDAQVFGIFLDGKNSQYPLVFGSIPFARTSWESLNSYAGPGQFPDGLPDTFNDENSTTPQTTPGEPIDPSRAALITYEFFRNDGYSDAAARGIYGNLSHESGDFRPDVVSLSTGTDLDGNSYGIAQWRGDRFRNLQNFARERGRNAGTLEVQLAFVKYELDTVASNGKAGLLRCTTPAQAAVHFMRKFERPAIAPSRQLSEYGDPVWTRTGIGTIYKRYGEDDRIRRAVDTRFDITAPQGPTS